MRLELNEHRNGVIIKRVPCSVETTLINSKFLSSVERPETATSCIAYILVYHRVTVHQ